MDEKLKILLCEDDENLGMLLREYLQAKGYDATLCPDGEVGFAEFQNQPFDICVLDVMMPKKDGFALAKEIRQINTEVPIIFLTAKTLKEDILEGFKIGADDYITKPFSMEEARVPCGSHSAPRERWKETEGNHSIHHRPIPLRHAETGSSPSARSKPNSPPRRTNCWHCSALTPTKSCSATSP